MIYYIATKIEFPHYNRSATTSKHYTFKPHWQLDTEKHYALFFPVFSSIYCQSRNWYILSRSEHLTTLRDKS